MRQNLRSDRLVPILAAGVAIGLLEVILAISFGTLVFSSALPMFVPQGIGLAILGMALTSVVIAPFTSLPGIVGGSQSAPAVITAVALTSVVAAMPTGGKPGATFVTAAVAIALTTAVTGLFLFGLGLFKLGSLGRFLPYPVVGGFLAGTGWLLVTGAVNTMVDLPQGAAQLSTLIQPNISITWLPGLILAVAMLLLLRRFDHPLAFPGLVLGGIGLFYLIAWSSGTSMVDLRAQGWLLGPFPDADLWPTFSFSELELVDWVAIMSQASSMIPILLVSSVSVLLNAGGLELATRHDIDLNRELRTAGMANLASSLVAGLVGYQQLSLSALNFKGKAQSRLVGIVAGGFCVLILADGAPLFSLIPKMVIGGLLFYLGLAFLVEWVIESWFKMPKIDYFIVLVILLVTMVIGYMQAVALGLLVAVVLFVVGYSRIDVVRHELTGASYHSRVGRSRQQRQFLEENGERVLILELQGFIFFGTAENLLTRVRRRFEAPNRAQPQYILLGLRRVTGLDSTAALSFARLQQLTESRGFTLIYARPSAQVRRQLKQGAASREQEAVRFVATLEQGVAWCEDQILQQAGIVETQRLPSLSQQLREILPDAADLSDLLFYFEEMRVEAGYCLIRQGELAQDIYFIEDGQATVILELGQAEPVRLEAIGGGIIGEIGFYLGQQRTASVVTDVPTTLYRLSRASMQRMEQENQQIANKLHRLIVHMLAERVTHLVKTVSALER